MSVNGRLSRRDFLRLRRTDRGRLLEVSCRALYMRCADASIAVDPQPEYEPWMGEPPAVFERRTAVDLVEALDRDLRDVQVLRLLEPEWLASLEVGPRVEAAIAAFRARGGIVDQPGAI